MQPGKLRGVDPRWLRRHAGLQRHLPGGRALRFHDEPVRLPPPRVLRRDQRQLRHPSDRLPGEHDELRRSVPVRPGLRRRSPLPADRARLRCRRELRLRLHQHPRHRAGRSMVRGCGAERACGLETHECAASPEFCWGPLAEFPDPVAARQHRFFPVEERGGVWLYDATELLLPHGGRLLAPRPDPADRTDARVDERLRAHRVDDVSSPGAEVPEHGRDTLPRDGVLAVRAKRKPFCRIGAAPTRAGRRRSSSRCSPADQNRRALRS